MAIPLKYNWRNLFVRKASTAMTVLGIALVVAVFVCVMALVDGLESAFRGSGSAANLLLLRQGAQSETQSNVSREQFQILQSLPGVAKGGDGKPLVSGEVIVLINHPRRDTGHKSNLIVRGLTPAGLEVRPGVKLVEGRWFRQGVSEVVASRRISNRFQNCAVGEKIHFGGREWTVSGTFEAGGTAFDSEVWTDAEDLIADFNRPGFSSALIKTSSKENLAALEKAISTDSRLKFKLQTEAAYYAEQMKTGTPIKVMGIFIAVIMAVGAAFGAANTMYAAVSARTREIGTLRSLGFSRISILTAFLLESMLLAAIGGVIGGLLALPINGYSTGTANWVTFSEVAFAFRVTPLLLLKGVFFAVLIGVFGGLLPAAGAARKPIVTALREV